MMSKATVFIAICVVLQCVSSETIQDVLNEYYPSVRKQTELSSSKIAEYEDQYHDFKTKLDYEFSKSIDLIANQIFEAQINMTVVSEKIASELSDYCFSTYLQEVDNFQVDLDQCYARQQLVAALKEIKLLHFLHLKIAGTLDECEQIFPEAENVEKLRECLRANYQANQVTYEDLSRSVASNLERAQNFSSACLKTAKDGARVDVLNIVIGFQSCIIESSVDKSM